jgi:hypothetical protein
MNNLNERHYKEERRSNLTTIAISERIKIASCLGMTILLLGCAIDRVVGGSS